MSEDNWEKIKTYIEGQGIELGPYFGHQIRNSPRHLLFTFSRYKFAARMLPQDKKIKVLELGCNEGLGSIMLGEIGHKVTAVDADSDAILWAKDAFKDNAIKVDFAQDDFLDKSYGKHDAVISLDVIEHIPKEKEDNYFNTIKNNLTEQGMCIIGTPNDTATKYASKASQIGHINMYTAERLTTALRKHFSHVFIFGMNDEVVHTGFYPMCHYLMAIACTPLK